MKKLIAVLLMGLALPCSAEYIEGYFENEDINAPWNDPLLQDDMFAPWNDPLLQDDMFAPWNNAYDGARETNRYLRENGIRDREYYWK